MPVRINAVHIRLNGGFPIRAVDSTVPGLNCHKTPVAKFMRLQTISHFITAQIFYCCIIPLLRSGFYA